MGFWKAVIASPRGMEDRGMEEEYGFLDKKTSWIKRVPVRGIVV